ncbi:hypothetical protein ABT224_20245 [Streptomyces sp. NPDC001584]|uniref:DUF6197 family protein n=1 Tax=Streptomyces sp. NPDC001584 TaxID=3154521 RepID=UPI00331BB37D
MTPNHLRSAAALIEQHGLHAAEGDFVAPDGALDICAALYQAATLELADAFRTDADAAIELIKASPSAMAAIRAVYDTLGYEVTTPDEVDPEAVIDSVSRWAMSAPFPDMQPPTRTEVIGRLVRTADALDQQATPLAA